MRVCWHEVLGCAHLRLPIMRLGLLGCHLLRAHACTDGSKQQQKEHKAAQHNTRFKQAQQHHVCWACKQRCLQPEASCRCMPALGWSAHRCLVVVHLPPQHTGRQAEQGASRSNGQQQQSWSCRCSWPHMLCKDQTIKNGRGCPPLSGHKLLAGSSPDLRGLCRCRCSGHCLRHLSDCSALLAVFTGHSCPSVGHHGTGGIFLFFRWLLLTTTAEAKIYEICVERSARGGQQAGGQNCNNSQNPKPPFTTKHCLVSLDGRLYISHGWLL